MFCMSEEEKLLQVGRLAEEVSKLKGELNHLNEKLARTVQAYAFAGQNMAQIFTQGGHLMIRSQPGRMIGQPQLDLNALLSAHELDELLGERERIGTELKGATDRLRALAPHLF
jgi:hypothetical protein